MWPCLDSGSTGDRAPKLLFSVHLALQRPDEFKEVHLANKWDRIACPSQLGR